MAPLSGHNLSPALAAWVLLAVHGIGWLLGCAERRTEITVVTADSSGVEIRTIHGFPELLSTLGLSEAGTTDAVGEAEVDDGVGEAGSEEPSSGDGTMPAADRSLIRACKSSKEGRTVGKVTSVVGGGGDWQSSYLHGAESYTCQ